MWGISELAEKLLACQGLCCMKLYLISGIYVWTSLTYRLHRFLVGRSSQLMYHQIETMRRVKIDAYLHHKQSFLLLNICRLHLILQYGHVITKPDQWTYWWSWNLWHCKWMWKNQKYHWQRSWPNNQKITNNFVTTYTMRMKSWNI
jgi:hypothetical protein